MVYYGSESGCWGADDPDDRMPMIWPELTYDDQQGHPLPGRTRPRDSVAFDQGLHDFYRDAIRLRGNLAALRRGRFQAVTADDAQESFVFSRTHERETVYIAINRSDREARLPCPFSSLDEGRPRLRTLLSTVVGGGAARLEQTGRHISLTMPPQSGVVFQATMQ
jgi:glycosidase